MPNTIPTEIEQLQAALDHALKQVSYWTERAAELATAQLEWSSKL